MRAAALALLAAVLGGCGAAPPRAAAPSASPLLAMAESRHYLEPLGRQRQESAVLGAQAMLGAYAARGDAGASCKDPACDDDRIETLRELAVAYSRLGLHRIALAVYRAVLEQRPGEATAHAD
ncbi:MAG: hypothetical protein RL684_3268, partial [Pseudomonadota bacterium]